MSFTIITLLEGVGLGIAMLALFALGTRSAARRLAQSSDKSAVDGGVIDASVFGLLGLLLAFTFSGAASRFDHRRELITKEVNAIGTAWLRIDMLPPATQPAIRAGFRRYLDARISAYAKLPDEAAAFRELQRAQEEQASVWAKAPSRMRNNLSVTSDSVQKKLCRSCTHSK